jgi:hypothetical protein
MSDHFCMTLIPSYNFAFMYLGLVLLFGARLRTLPLKCAILAFFLSMQFFASSGLHYTNWLSCRCPTWRSI